MNYDKPKERPEIGKFYGFDHVTLYVGNAFQAASFYTSRFGFDFYAYSGLETNDRKVASHVVKKNDIIFVFKSSYEPSDSMGIGKHVSIHGDGVKDVAFQVEDCRKSFSVAKKRGAKVVREPTVLKDEKGEVVVATI